MKKTRRPKPRLPAGPVARLPMPKKIERRHANLKKYDRAREKVRLRRHPEL